MRIFHEIDWTHAQANRLGRDLKYFTKRAVEDYVYYTGWKLSRTCGDA